MYVGDSKIFDLMVILRLSAEIYGDQEPIKSEHTECQAGYLNTEFHTTFQHVFLNEIMLKNYHSFVVYVTRRLCRAYSAVYKSGGS